MLVRCWSGVGSIEGLCVAFDPKEHNLVLSFLAFDASSANPGLEHVMF